MENSFKSFNVPQAIEIMKQEHNLPIVKEYRRNGKGKVLAYVLAEDQMSADAICDIQDYLRNIITRFMAPFAVSSITFLFSYILVMENLGKATWKTVLDSPVVTISGICMLICIAYFTYLFIKIVQLDRTVGRYIWLADELYLYRQKGRV